MSFKKIRVNSYLIMVFSKDRPDRLERTLPYLKGTRHKVVLIDDSSKPDNQVAVRRLCRLCNFEYHGRAEQEKLVQKVNVTLLDNFISPLGQNIWSLGYNRNYAIICGLLLGSSKMILMDDDVIVDHELLDTVFRSLSCYPFVGVEITLMPDHSVVGHLYRIAGKLLPQYVSGTLLGINLNRVTHYFLNIYNEDWIWLFLENNGEMVPKVGSVKQLKYKPFEEWESKIVFQEFGEIVWDGLYYSTSPIKREDLESFAFWTKALRMRKQEIRLLDKLAIPTNLKSTATSIQRRIFDLHRELLPKPFVETFKKYFEFLDDWQFLLSVLRRTNNRNQTN